MAEETTKKKKRKRNPFLAFIRFLLLLFVLAIIAVAGAGYYAYLEYSPEDTQGVDVEITIPQSSSTAQIADILLENDIIGNSYVFRAYSRYVAGSDGTYQYGTFTLNTADGYDEVIKTLQQVSVQRDTVNVTFPEGYNAFQIGAVLEESGLVTQDEFITALNTLEFDYDFLDGITEDASKPVHIDGFLFPDTYSFYPDATVEHIINTILTNFQTKVLTEENLALLEQSRFSLEEWVIFASIVQKEAANVEEMYNVSSVFNNRMDTSAVYPNLESCTTNNYIADYLTPYFDGAPTVEVLNAYDTYASPGLPVGAIANPGLDALVASLTPNDTPYFFFVTDVEYTHYYGTTFNEHLVNIEKAKAVNRTYGIEGLIS